MIEHSAKSTPNPDSRLEACPICGSEMLVRFKNNMSPAWVFSCSNEDCVLHRLKNNIRVDAYYDGKALTEREAYNIINKRT